MEMEKKLEFVHPLAQSVLDGLADSVIVIGPDYRVIAMNKAARREHLGTMPLSRSVFCYQVTHRRNDPCSGDGHPCPLRKAQVSGQPVTAIHNHSKSDGTAAVYEILLSPVFDERGLFVYVVETGRDVTDRIRAEKVLKEGQDQIRTVMDSISAGVMIIDPEKHTIVDVNFSAEQLIGKSKEDIVGSICHGYVCPTEAGNCPITDLGQTVNLSERKLINSGGEHVPILKSASSVKLRDRTFLVESFVDITRLKFLEEELRTSEYRCRALFDNLTDAAFVSDAETGAVLDTNLEAERLLGLTRDEIIGMNRSELHPPAERERYRKRFDKYLSEGSESDYDGEVMRKDGAIIPVNISSVYLVIAGKQVILSLFRDITDRKRAEDRIRELNEALEMKVMERTGQLLDAQEELVRNEKLSVLGRLAGSVGHELRNPLAVIRNAAYFLKTVIPHTDDRITEYLEIIRTEVDNCHRIISDLLDFSRTRPPQKCGIPVKDIVEQSLEKCGIPGNVDVKREIPDGLPQLVVDPFQMGQVFQNLVANAIQAMPDGGSLFIGARLVTEPIEPRSAEKGQQRKSCPNDQGTADDGPGSEFIEM